MGEPLDGATVAVRAHDPLLDTTSGLDFLNTETRNGAFAITLPNAILEYIIEPQLAGYRFSHGLIAEEPFEQPFSVAAEDLEDVTLIMDRSGLIAGIVVDIQGAPVAHVHLECAAAGEETQNWFAASARTGEEGGFVFGDLSAGEYAIWGRYSPREESYVWERFSPLGSRENPLTVVALSRGEWKENTRITVPLDSRRCIDGVVLGEEGEPLSGAEVWAIVPGGAGVAQAPETTPDSGVFRLRHILPHLPVLPDQEVTHVTVCASREGYEPVQLEEVAVGTQGVEVRMMEERRGSVHVRLFDAVSGEHVLRAAVYMWRSDTAWGASRVNRDFFAKRGEGVGANLEAGGWFVFNDLPAGSADLVIEAEEYGFRQEQGIPVVEGEVTRREIALKAAGVLCAHMDAPGAIDGWSIHPGSIAVWPAGVREGDHPLNVYSEGESNNKAACAVEEEDRRKHRDFTLAPGAYDVQWTVHYVSALTDPGAGCQYVRSTRTLEAVVEPGSITQVTLNDFGENGARLIVELPENLPRLPRVELMQGEGVEERVALPAEPSVRSDRDSYANGQTIDTQHFQSMREFPFVAPGHYSVVVRMPGSDQEWIREVTLASGECERLRLE
jgi:hypothetical protein